MRKAWFAALVAAVALCAPVAAKANAVTDWNRIATNTLVAVPGPAGGAPPAMQINMAMTQGAVYDAVNATTPKHWRPYLLTRRFGATSQGDLAVATAAHRMLTYILSGAPEPFPNRAALQAGVDAPYNGLLAGIPDSPFRDRGIQVGDAAADAMIASRQDDGRFGPSAWGMQTGAGFWQPLVVGGVPQLDPTPWVGNVRPFLLNSSSQFRTAGPSSLGSAQWVADYNEVKLLGRVNSAARDATMTHNAIFWQTAGGPVMLWNSVARDLTEDPKYKIDFGESARLFAMMNLASADAGINCWNDKYYWDFWRPWNAIPGDDGNPLTDHDTTWTALITAPYPEHPSGHLCLDGAMLRVLQMVFGEGTVPFSVTSSRFPADPPRQFNSFAEPLAEITEARIWAGLHFRTADTQGKALGHNVAEYAAANFFQPVGNH
jgi:hypothetical protein